MTFPTFLALILIIASSCGLIRHEIRDRRERRIERTLEFSRWKPPRGKA